MLSDEEFIDQVRAELRAGLEVLKPSQEFHDALEELTRENGRAPHGSLGRPAGRGRRHGRVRVRGLGAAVPVLAAVIVVLVVGAVALTSLRSDHSSTPAGVGIATHDGKIAFISGWSLEFSNPDGSGLRRLGEVPHQCDVPGIGRGVGCFAWSPDGTRFAYLAGGSHALTLFVVGADGQHPRALTVCGDCLGVSWSPDGSQIAVGRYAAGQINVWVVNATTGAMHRITDCRPNSATCAAAGPIGTEDTFGDRFQVQWSPNGQKIFFIRFAVPRAGANAVGSLFTVRPDGSDLTEPKIRNPQTAFWSPDGRELAVISRMSGSSRSAGAYVVDAAGTARKLAKLWIPQEIAWSPDGRKLAIAADGGIYTIPADGKALTRDLTPQHAVPFAGEYRIGTSVAWSPNGKEVAYGTYFAGDVGLWTINVDGSGRRLIFETSVGPGDAAAIPIWSPDGRQIAFSSTDGTYLANADGSSLRHISQGAQEAFAWQPIPSTR
jgi:Tol biopolymer transport system component